MVLAALVVGAALATLAVLVGAAPPVGADPFVAGVAVIDAVDEPHAAIKSATPARTTPIRRT